jgi:serine/threonine-protein kinase HipA
VSESLTAYIGGQRVGWFTRSGSGTEIDFTFDDAWRNRARRMEMTLSMPKSRRKHRGDAPENYLWNLLPDNEGVLKRWGAKFSVSPRNPMALLEHVGMDTAGAVQLSVQDEAVLAGPEGFEPISDTEIAGHIRQLGVDPDAWLFSGHESGYFSLAGAQSKFALAQMSDGSWAVPTGRAPSTHIVKPGIRGLEHSDLNEHLSLAAASLLGIRAAESRVMQFENQTAIVVTRYDRVLDAGQIIRIHQEDMAQAAGAHPTGKYQNDGGPSIQEIADLIMRTRTSGSDASVVRFFAATLFNWAILGTDAHAKNYSLLHSESGPDLAPLYDVATALPYPDVNNPRKVKLAMAFGKHYRDFEIEARHVLEDAALLGIDPQWAYDRARAIIGGVAEAYSQAARSARLTGDNARFAALIVDKAAARAKVLGAELQNTSVPEGSATRDRRAAQARSRAGKFR